MIRYVISFFYAVLIVSLTGMTDLAYAISCSDVVDQASGTTYSSALGQFLSINGTTYAISRSAVTGANGLPDGYFAFSPGISHEYLVAGVDAASLKKMLAAGMYGAARPLSIRNATTQEFILKHYGKRLKSGGGTLINVWKEYNAPAFTTIQGQQLAYTNWATTPAIMPQPAAVAMDSDGKWTPVTSGQKLSQIVEFDGKLDCAIDMNPSSISITPPPPPPSGSDPPGPGTSSNANDPFAIKDVVCAQDLNQNGFVGEPNEIMNCLQTPQGPLCPVGALDCATTYQDPVCPSGSILNPGRDMCQKDPEQVKCPAGYTWDQTIDKCVMYPPCPDSGTYNAITDRCEKLIRNDCPAGYAFDTTFQICQKAVVCPDGGVFNPSRDRCESPVVWICPTGYSFNSDVAKCEAPPSCPAGWMYSNTTDRCQQEPNNCPAGYSYNPVLDRCTVPASCSAGGALNGISDTCELTAAFTCNSGWTYNNGTGKCEQLPACASPGSYDVTYNVCITPSTGASCPTGYYYNSSYAACVAAPICNSGSYNAAHDRCEVSPSFSCPDPGYTYNSGRGRCEKIPVCPGGMSYSASLNVCTQPITPACAGGYSYNASRGRCEQTPACPAGTIYNSVTNRCEGSPACSSGTYAASTDTCVSSGTYAATGSYYCPAGGTLSGSSCVTSGSYPATPRVDYVECPPGCSPITNCAMGVCQEQCFCPPDGYYSRGTVTSYSCPSGGTLSGTTCTTSSSYSASISYSCASGGTLSGTTCTTTSSSAATCPAGTYLDGAADRCVANPTCPGGSFDSANDLCWVAYIPSCTQGVYDSSSGLCVAAPICNNGLLDGTADTCYQAPSSGCPGGYSLSGNICTAPPSCAVPGSFNGGSVDLCLTAATNLCPGGYSYSSGYGQCYRTADCNGGGLNPVSDTCEMAYSLTCPTGYSTVGSICQAVPFCTSGGSYNPSLDICDAGSNVCSAGLFDPSLDVCYQAAGCAGGTLNGARDKCEATATPTCGTLAFDSTTLVCYSPPICDLGAYQALRGRCEATVTRNCGVYSLNVAENTCVQTVTCPTDTTFPLNSTIQFSSILDRCLSDAEHICSAGLTWNGLPVMKCEALPICPGAIYYDWTTHSCLVGAACPSGSSTTVLADCPAGCTPVKNCGVGICQEQCFCPPDQYYLRGAVTGCVQNPGLINAKGQGGWQCSPNRCVNVGKDGDPDIGDKMDESYLQNDGEKDADGNCLGTVYIFGGKPSRCRPPGLTVGMMNDCCEPGGQVISEDTGSNIQSATSTLSTLYDVGTIAYGAYLASTGAEGMTAAGELAMNSSAVVSDAIAVSMEAIANGANLATALSEGVAAFASGMMASPAFIVGVVIMVAMKIIMGGGCDKGDIQTTMSRDSGMCHYVGDFCYKKWALVGCVQQAKGYCCYNSKLARIMAEQGRPQLNVFGPDGGWGPAHAPNCRGFRPEEFQAIDFNRIDLTEYYDVVEKDIADKIQGAQQNLTNTIQQRYQQIQGQ